MEITPNQLEFTLMWRLDEPMLRERSRKCRLIIGKKFVNKKIIILAFIFHIIFFLIWYHYPIKKVMTISVCTLDGRQEDIYFNIKFHRSFIWQTYATGRIIFREIEYVDITQKRASVFLDNYNIFENIKNKIRSKGKPYLYFVNSTVSFPDDMADFVVLWDSDGSLNMGAFSLLVPLMEGEQYYGPANTIEEAFVIHERLMELKPNENITDN